MAETHETTTSTKFDEILARLKDLKQDNKDNKNVDTPPDKIPLIDPTANVLSLVAAAIARQDDLRVAENKRTDDLRKQQMTYEKELQTVRDQAQKDLTNAESNRINAITLAESRRIDALLAAATNAVALASEKAGAQAATLAQQVATSAEALRAQVAATASSTNALITQVRETLEGRLTKVEQNQYQSGGRESVSDRADLVSQAAQAASIASAQTNRNLLIYLLVFAFLSLFGTFAGIGVAVYMHFAK
jgi:hypothetical protein